MDRNTKLIIGAVVLAGASAWFYTSYKKDSQLGSTAAKPDLPELKGEGDVDKISLTNGDKGEVVLEKKGDKWMITKPVSALANQGNVKSLLDNMKELKITDTAVVNATDDIKKTYEVDATKGVHVIAWKGTDKKVDATFGKTGGLGDSVIVPGHSDIYLAKGYSGWMYGREIKDWRDREIFKFDDANVTNVTLVNATGAFAFVKAADKWTGTLKDKPIPRFDAEKVKSMLVTFKTLNADDFGDGKPAAETGLDAPEATITIQGKDGLFVLKLGKTQTGAARYAMKDPDPTIYVVGPVIGEWAMAPVDKFQQPLDGGAKDAAPAEPMGMPPGMMPPGMMPPGMMPPGHP
ncbi:hypothetical protein BH09MYX1_BH09MYX1_52440 [soil metagenome]